MYVYVYVLGVHNVGMYVCMYICMCAGVLCMYVRMHECIMCV